jgi:DNA modification methylase
MKSQIKIDPKNLLIIPITEIKINPKNRNKHSKEQIDRLCLMIEEGFRDPLIISNRTGLLVCGHGRIEAAQKLGMSHLPVIYQDFESEEEEYTFAVGHNAIARWAELDLPAIRDDLKNLPNIVIDLLGIENFQIEPEKIEPQCDEDDVPGVQESFVKLGDIWKLGNHRLMCGDSTSIDAVEKLMNGEKPILMVTDPPYGVKLDQSWRDQALGDKALGQGNSNLVMNDDRSDWYDVWAIAPAQIAYVWHASSFTDVVMESLRKSNFEVRQQIIWNKSVMVMGRSAYHFKHEPCWYAVKKGCDANWKGDRKQTTVWDAAPPNHIMGGSKEDKTGHPTQKPVILYEVPIQNHTEINDSLYEPFGGSGTAIIACEKTNRKCFMMELDPHYCAVIIERWQKYTGKKAERIHGET